MEDYAVAGLKISDIELAGRVEEDSLATEKGGIEVISLPSRTYKAGQPVVIYYEVYGLKGDDFGRTKYRVGLPHYASRRQAQRGAGFAGAGSLARY